MKFAGRAGVVYTVAGKGGLVREVLLPHSLAERLEAGRLDVPERVVDRGVRYLQRYVVGGGHAFSTLFSRASIEALPRQPVNFHNARVPGSAGRDPLAR